MISQLQLALELLKNQVQIRPLHMQVRPLYMHFWGGVYADIDFVALRPFEELFEQQEPDTQILLGQDCGIAINYNKSRREQVCKHDQSIPNAFMASTPGHPFWEYVIVHSLRQVWREGPLTSSWPDANAVTGPLPLYFALVEYAEHVGNHTMDVTVLPEEIFSLSWTERENDLGCCWVAANNSLNTACCRDMFPNAWVVTFWTASWKH